MSEMFTFSPENDRPVESVAPDGTRWLRYDMLRCDLCCVPVLFNESALSRHAQERHGDWVKAE